jgi:hypothetical protein
LRTCEEITTGAGSSGSSISYVITARCFSTIDTIRLVRMTTFFPAGVRHTISRSSTPSRKSMLRS